MKSRALPRSVPSPHLPSLAFLQTQRQIFLSGVRIAILGRHSRLTLTPSLFITRLGQLSLTSGRPGKVL